MKKQTNQDICKKTDLESKIACIKLKTKLAVVAKKYSDPTILKFKNV